MNNKVISCKTFSSRIKLEYITVEQRIKLFTLGIDIRKDVQIHPELMTKLLDMPKGQEIKIGNYSKIGNCTLIGKIDIGQHCNIGDDAILENNVTLQQYVTIGKSTLIYGTTTIHKNLTISNNSFIENANIHKNLDANTQRHGSKNVNGGETATIHPRRKNFIQGEEE